MKSRILIALYVFAVLGFQIVKLNESIKTVIAPIQEVVREDPSRLFPEVNSLLNKAFQEIHSRAERILIGEKKINANQLVLTGMRIAEDSQVWLDPSDYCSSGFVDCMHPVKERTHFTGTALNLETLGYPTNKDGVFFDWHGQFEVNVEDEEGLFVITGSNEALNNLVIVTVAGKRPQDIEIEIRNMQEENGKLGQ